MLSAYSWGKNGENRNRDRCTIPRMKIGNNEYKVELWYYYDQKLLGSLSADGVIIMKRTKYPIHPDFKKWTNMNPPLNRALLPVIQRSMELLFTMEKSTADLTVERKIIPVGNGDTIRALWYCPKDVAENAPCDVDLSGGG